MITERTNYTIVERIKITEIVKNGKSKCKIPEGTIHGRMKEEIKCWFVESIGDKGRRLDFVKLLSHSILVKRISQTTDKLGASDIRSDSENNGNDSCEVVVPKLSKVLENISEVII
jgi:hypothetical protein